MSMRDWKLHWLGALCLVLTNAVPVFAQTALSGAAQQVFMRAQTGRWYADAARLKPDILPTSDGRSFLAIWKPPGVMPRNWLVTLHGSRGFATDDLAIWERTLAGREIGILALQWWVGSDDATPSYYSPLEIYREIDMASQRLGIQPGMAALHGFSRGSANSYAVAAIDAGRGRRYFNLVIASSGGVALDYSPTRAIVSGAFGNRPLAGTRWITVAGGRDENPDRDGVPAMRRTAAWLKEQGATVVAQIEDSSEGHGALQRNPSNARRVIELFSQR
jgi:hypothetical protein